jgi:DNA-binding NarL/FixJ family response regulator
MDRDRRILIADDHDLFRRGLRYALLDAFEGVEIVEAKSIAEATAALGRQDGFVLASFDLRMPGMDWGRALPGIRRMRPSLPIVVLSGFEERRHVLAAIEFGASGFVPKSQPTEQIVAAMREVMAGRIYLPPSVTAMDDTPSPDLTEAAPAADSPPPTLLLTPRQRDVLDLLLGGRSTKEIGRALDLAEGTVKVHLAALFRLLGARNRVEAVAAAISLGLLRGPP